MGKNRLTVAKYLEQQIAISDKTQAEIATAVGYEKPNVITMIKQGKTKLPINKVGPFAKALNIDPSYLLALSMSEYMPDSWATVQEFMGTHLVSQDELRLLAFIRESTGNVPVEVDLKDVRWKSIRDTLKAIATTEVDSREGSASIVRQANVRRKNQGGSISRA